MKTLFTHIEVDGCSIEADQGATVIDACREAGIEVPSLCHMKGSAPFTSCMLCTVEDADSGRAYPACSVKVRPGMRVRTRSETISGARRNALELLLSEHVGNCEGPCRNGCPAHLNIPVMLNRIANGDLETAARQVELEVALPSVVERLCPAMCEMTCRRRFEDASVGIRRLALHVADLRFEHKVPLPDVPSASGKRIAVVGAGPAGLAAAWFARLAGHMCDVFDDHAEPGGALRYGLPPGRLPLEILNAECERVRAVGAQLRMDKRIGRDISMSALIPDYDAVVIAVGKVRPEVPAAFGIPNAFNGFHMANGEFRTPHRQVFVIGDALRARQLCANAVGDGKAVIQSITHMFKAQAPVLPKRFDSKISCPDAQDMATLLVGANPRPAIQPVDPGGNFTKEEARQESERCMHCECLAAESCKLRYYADVYGASQNTFRLRPRTHVERIRQHASVIFEPGKCIKCGICVRIAEQAREPLGLTFVGRGFDVRIGVPLGRTLNEGLTQTARACVEGCPTAALAFGRADQRSRST